MSIDDSFRALPDMLFRTLSPDKLEPPIATCPRDGEPLISTMKYRGAEFYCVVCKGKFGFMAPVPKTATPELLDRLKELETRFELNRHD